MIERIIGRFASPEAADLATINDRIAAAKKTLAEKEALLSSSALDIALAEDETAGAGLTDEIARLRVRIETLEKAIPAAEQRERDRQDEEAAKFRQSQVRALKQHFSRARGAAARYGELQQRAAVQKRLITDALQSAQKLLPAGAFGGFSYSLSDAGVDAAAAVESHRTGGVKLGGSIALNSYYDHTENRFRTLAEHLSVLEAGIAAAIMAADTGEAAK